MRQLLASVVAVSFAALLAAQTPPPAKPQQQPTFRAGVQLVSVDVYASRDGQAVDDLRKEDFEVREDGVLQRIETFERVGSRVAPAEIERDEPANGAESNEAAADPHNRVFVVFYDTMHTIGYLRPQDVAGVRAGSPISYDQRTTGRALSRFFHRLIGPDDLVALTTPEMAVTALTFTRRPSSLDDFFLTGGHWEQRWGQQFVDEQERRLASCPQIGPALVRVRRDNLTLAALRGLIAHLENLREARKVVFVVSEGFATPGPAPIGPVPGTRMRPPRPPRVGGPPGAPSLDDPMTECEKAAMEMSTANAEQEFREILTAASSANLAFYPIDPRGLEPERLNQEWLRTLASATGGTPIINTNDPTPGLERVAREVSSYYLLGYYSRNSRADGKFRGIKVRVSRGGVQLSARPGYYAASAADAAERAKANGPPPDAETVAFNAALETLEHRREEQPILLRGAYDWPQARASGAALLSVIAELDAAAARQPGWADGAQLSATLLDLDGRKLSSSAGTLSRTARSCLVRFPDSQPPGDYLARVVVKRSVLQTTEQVRVKVPDMPGMIAGSVVFRRGPFTGVRFQPTADMRFRRAEHLRVEAGLPGGADSVAARLLDRKGKPLAVPVIAAVRDAERSRVAMAELTLAPLAPADYVLELSVTQSGKTERALTAFRIVP